MEAELEKAAESLSMRRGSYFFSLFIYFYPKEKLLCLHSYRTIGSVTYGFIISVANFIYYEISETV